MTEITVTYLAMIDPGQHRPKPLPPNARVAMLPTPMPELNRFFYTAIGGPYTWYERLPWSKQQWHDYVSRPGIETWVLTVDGVPAGYFELVPDGETVDLRLFGLLAPYTGQGYGGGMLSVAVNRAWERGAKSVTVDTCTLDSPTALSHYRARGFEIVGTKTKVEDLANVGA
jgi:GNAT superfamily N-acetyltransferase